MIAVLRCLVALSLTLASAMALADPAGCTTWAYTSSVSSGTSAFGDQAGFCSAAAADAAGLGGTQVSCTASSPYSAVEVVNFSGTEYTFTFTRNGCTAPPPESAASAIVGTVVLQLPAFLDLSAEDGFLLSVAIIGVWAMAFSWRAVIRVLRTNDGDET